MTDCRDETENAHIIPRAEDAWFRRNAMYEYNSTVDVAAGNVIDDVRNGFLLRRDLHHAYDRPVFCHVAKEGKIVTHFVLRTHEMGMYYHNAEFRLPNADPCVEFFWARFAWTVIPLAQMFTPAQRVSSIPPPVSNPAEENEDGNGNGKSNDETPRPRKRANRPPTGSDKKTSKKSRSSGTQQQKTTRPVTTQQDSLSPPPYSDKSEEEADQCKRERFFPSMSMLPSVSGVPRLLTGWSSGIYDLVPGIYVADGAVVSRVGANTASEGLVSQGASGGVAGWGRE